MSVGPAGVQEFLDFLRASGVAEAQIPPFQRVAEQLQLVCGTLDLMEVSPEQTTMWRDALRARNPTEAQLALIARGISALHAFQRRRSAPLGSGSKPPLPDASPGAVPQASPPTPLPHPVAGPPSPYVPSSASGPAPSPASSRPSAAPVARRPGMGTVQKALAIGFLAAVVVGSVIYTVVASRAAVQEGRGDGEILAERNAKRKVGIFYPAYTFTRQPAVSCDPEVIGQVNDAVEASAEAPLKALKMLGAALDKDPRCVPAARVLTTLAARTGGPLAVVLLRSRLVESAERDPRDARSQLMAAYYSRQMGDGAGYRKYLDRTEAADPNQPLLEDALGLLLGPLRQAARLPERAFLDPRRDRAHRRHRKRRRPGGHLLPGGRLRSLGGSLRAFWRQHPD